MARLKRGDRVTVATREVTPADRKSGLYYAHFAGLHGVVDQVYEEEGEVCVEVDQDTLPHSFEARHLGIQDHVRQRWLNGISDQERRNLPEEQKALRLKYTIMLAPDDLAPEGRTKKSRPAEKAVTAAAEIGASTQASAGGAPRPPAPPAPAPDTPRPAAARAEPPPAPQRAQPASRRLSEEDLAAAEEAHLAEIRRRAGE